MLGANDGLISTASLLMGVAAARVDSHTLLLTGVASLIAGAISMAAGEYVSVSSQADTEKADLAKEAYELEHNSDRELKELTHIYVQRGLTPVMAHDVAVALTAHNALEAHARDEIGLTDTASANPLRGIGSIFYHRGAATGAVYLAVTKTIFGRRFGYNYLDRISIFRVVIGVFGGCQNFPCHCTGGHLGRYRVGYHQPYR